MLWKLWYNNNLEGFLLKTDQEKAFDRAGHEYLFAILEKFDFGLKFRNWVKIFYTSIFSSVKYNGFLTPYFRLKNSVKQGYPISALLYVLLAEPWSEAIKQNDKINRNTKFLIQIEKLFFLLQKLMIQH